jgi:hypothetical protein
MSDHGVKSESCHFSMAELRTTHQKSLDWAKEIGITQIITATLSGPAHPTMDDVKKAADEYNKIAAVSAKAGLPARPAQRRLRNVLGGWQTHLRPAHRSARSQAGEIPIPDVHDHRGLRRRRLFHEISRAAFSRCTSRTSI